MDKGRAARRIAVRCPRTVAGCKGQLYLEMDLAGHVASLICLHCARSAGYVSTDTLVERFGWSPRDVERASVQAVPFVWFRLEDS